MMPYMYGRRLRLLLPLYYARAQMSSGLGIEYKLLVCSPPLSRSPHDNSAAGRHVLLYCNKVVASNIRLIGRTSL